MRTPIDDWVVGSKPSFTQNHVMGFIHWLLDDGNAKKVIPNKCNACNSFFHLFLDGVGAIKTSDLYGHFQNDTLKQTWLNQVACGTRIEHTIDSPIVKRTLFDCQVFTSRVRDISFTHCSNHFVCLCGYRFFFKSVLLADYSSKDSSSMKLIFAQLWWYLILLLADVCLRL